MNYTTETYYKKVFHRIKKDNIKLSKENEQLTSNNLSLRDDNNNATDILRKENNMLKYEVYQLKSICNELYKKNINTEQMIKKISSDICKIRSFQTQDFVASQELKNQFDKINNIPDDIACKRLEEFAVQNTLSFLSTV